MLTHKKGLGLLCLSLLLAGILLLLSAGQDVLVLNYKDVRYGLLNESDKLVLPREKIAVLDSDFELLKASRNQALDRGYLLRSDRKWVAGKWMRDADSDSVKIRLKGRLPDHFSHDYKWSFRVKRRGVGGRQNWRVFSLQNPLTRWCLNEWFYRQFSADLGLIALDYEFSRLSVNKKDFGIYARDEHATNLLSRQRFNRSIIVKYDEEAYYGIIMQERTMEHFVHAFHRGFLNAPIKSYRPPGTGSDSLILLRQKEAEFLLDRFRAGRLSPSEVFDVQEMARVFALSDLLGTSYHHPLWYHNIVFLLNDSGKLQPVVTDNTFIGALKPGELIGSRSTLLFRTGNGITSWFDLFLRDQQFLELYLGELQRLSEPAILNDFFKKKEVTMSKHRQLFEVYFPGYRFNTEMLYSNQQVMRQFLSELKHSGQGVSSN